MDEATRDLLASIRGALTGMADWRAVAVCSTVDGVLAGEDDPGAAADWLVDFLATHQREGGDA
jgi:hypothetical protein